jgi:hypothetical protein
MNVEAGADGAMKIIKILSVACAVIAVIVTIVFFGWWTMKDRIEFGHEKFDQISWITPSANPEKTCHRGDMAYDLQQNVLKPGMMRDQIMAILGRPSWEDPQQIEYDLGKCLQAEHGLRLFFNANDQLTHSRISQH